MPSKIYSDYSRKEDAEDDDDDDDHYIPDDNPYELHGGDGGPWLLVIDDFLDTEEVNRLIELGEWEGYERSTLIEDTDDDDDDETVSDSDEKADRTSSTAWCQSRTCKNDEISQDVIDRVYELVQFDDLHAEDLQLLHYEVGQYYLPHHDFYYIDNIDEWNQDGGRVLTVFIYLNDVVDGGGTNFPRLNITVTPKLGRVVIWPSVLDNNPRKIDWRTEHEALPVKDGEKYGANLWFHLKPKRKAYFNYECDKPKNNTNGSTRNMHRYDDDDDDELFDDDDDDDDDDEFYEEDADEDRNHLFEKIGLHLDEDEDDDVAKEL
ncbi:hypothetical protein FRACYDRAFT_178438 [Fragilariopsis cylindrus CCMP1102]|uniref:Fe2OG dioxygenase domain-containing protein n=1 Tax=Fragilariopsis cylindrus CCMP1102 TaxID=635003 RepID=A0A1E7FY23_9STRA|nr:hypothetical protein FRACYDRAFT_178438 [Fragilariopsis cylindrus CCMP1102]|eukprot:OEU23049.1 hypothetical protein FRACYDRAFT_178438 [Fragilariopsis cylindrus CCMP1102]